MTLAATIPAPAGLAHRIRLWVGAISGRRRAAVAFAAGSLSVLAFAPVFFAPILFLTLPCLVWLIDSSSNTRAAAIASWWFGFGYFFFNLFWIGEAFLVEADKFAILLPVAITLLPAGLALFWACAGAAARLVWPGGLARVLVLAITLSVAEWLRGHVLTGLPWNVIGYALTYPLSLMQSAALLGVYGLTPIAILIFTAPLVCIADRTRAAPADWVRAFAIAIIPLAGLWTYGVGRLAVPQTFLPDVKIRIVQPSVPQREKWLPEFQKQIFDDHLALSIANAEGIRDDLAGITHVIWPEAAMPFLPLETPVALKAIADMLPDGRVLVTGALRRETKAGATAVEAFNSLMAFNANGGLSALYDKIHLVPFGEYLPVEPVLTAIGLKKLTHGRGSFSVGVQPRPLINIAGLPPVAGLICYEVLFPGEIVQGGQRPGLLINVTNDGWFGNTTGPRQHFHQTRVRAVEEGVPLIRAANNGISAVIDRNGRVLGALGLNVRGIIDSQVPAGAGPTPYTRFGDSGLSLMLVLFAAAAAALWPKKSKK